MTSPQTTGHLGPEEGNPKNKASHDFQYEGWNVTIEVDAAGDDGHVSGHADLYDGSALRCRVMLSGRHRDGVSAIQALASKARALIDERRGEVATQGL
ncbi:MAG: hypothetical protein J7549_05745 [Variovorax sp.]|nr:hypothetical protein [Variovorax sp.]